MKTIVNKTNMGRVLAMAFFIGSFYACSDAVSERREYAYTTITSIPDDEVNNLEISIHISENRTVIDPSKIKLEVKLEHTQATDILLQYRNPGGTYLTIFNFLGADNDFAPQNTLVFGSTHTLTNFNTAGGYVLGGNYTSMTNDVNAYPVEVPLFEQTRNMNISGTWNFFISDVSAGESGNLHSIKLIFEEGALSL